MPQLKVVVEDSASTGCCVQPPKRADVIEQTTRNPEFLRQAQREFRFKTRNRVIVASKRVIKGSATDRAALARADTKGFKSADAARVDDRPRRRAK